MTDALAQQVQMHEAEEKAEAKQHIKDFIETSSLSSSIPSKSVSFTNVDHSFWCASSVLFVFSVCCQFVVLLGLPKGPPLNFIMLYFYGLVFVCCFCAGVPCGCESGPLD